MGRIQVEIPDEMEKELRWIILEKYKKHQLKEFVILALDNWIKSEQDGKQI